MILIVDATYICHVEKHVKRRLSYGEHHTGVVFGFFETILRLATKFNTNKFVFAWDSRKSFRSELFPDYKNMRHRHDKDKSEEDIAYDEITYKQFNALKNNILNRVGFQNNFVQTGLEADDVIASIAMNSNNSEIMLVTDDADLYQCISENCSVYRPRAKKIRTYKNFKEEWGIEPEKWADVLAYAGCRSDDVPGITRVGKPTAAKFIRGDISGFGKIGRRLASPMGTAIYERNLKLVKLPFEGTQVFKIKEDTLHLNRFLNFFEEYGFYSFLKSSKLREWKSNLRLE